MSRWHNHYIDNHAHFCTATITEWRPLLTDATIPILYMVWEEARALLGAWKERPRVLPIYSDDIVATKIDYLHRNPVRTALVENPGDWEHSSFCQLVLDEEDIPFSCDKWSC